MPSARHEAKGANSLQGRGAAVNQATEGANPQARGEGSQEPGKAGGAEEHA